jgi:hypothetical protein
MVLSRRAPDPPTAGAHAVVVTIRNYVASARPQCDQYEDFGSRLRYYLDPTPAPMRDDKGWCGGADRLRFAPSER